jgi:phosphate starvation-inducible PhoH-like protein
MKRKQQRQQKRGELAAPVDYQSHYRPERVFVPFQPRTVTQKVYGLSIDHNTVTFGVGPAGTGKTFVPVVKAVEMLLEGTIKKIVITRPAVPGEEDLGALPGTLEEKYAPYLEPFMDSFHECLGAQKTSAMLGHQILAKPLAYMRGKTFKDSFIILDEAQNTTARQMKMFLTRIGNDSKVVVNGDLSQQDTRGLSGLLDGLTKIGHLKGVGVVEFSASDCVRSGLVRDILFAYNGSN